MKFEITVIGDTAKVKNVSDTDLKRANYELPVGKTVEMTVDQAKIRLGNWEDTSFKEKKRKEELGLHRYELKIKVEKEKVKEVKRNEMIKQVEEVEFAGLNDEPEEKSEVQCQAITKSGGQCKRMVYDGENYCTIHRNE